MKFLRKDRLFVTYIIRSIRFYERRWKRNDIVIYIDDRLIATKDEKAALQESSSKIKYKIRDNN